MNREHWKKMLPIITAFANGKIIEHRDEGGWVGIAVPEYAFTSNADNYRIKKPERWVNLYEDVSTHVISTGTHTFDSEADGRACSKNARAGDRYLKTIQLD